MKERPSSKQISKTSIQEDPWQNKIGILNISSIQNNYLTYEEVQDLIEKLTDEFPDIVTLKSIGDTYQGNHILMLEVNPQKTNKSSQVLMTGAHHARELTTIEITLYILLKVIYNFVNNDEMTIQLLSQSQMMFVPVVNVDGFKLISDDYRQSGVLTYIRKNRNDGKKDNYVGCFSNDEMLGVDLNRNYGYEFAYNDQGSSGNPCAEDFRGPYPFSEPETRAIKNLVEQYNSTMKFAINFHAFGNLFIYPFNYDTETQNLHLSKNFPEQAKIYDELSAEIGLPNGNVKGNAMQSIQYEANGESSDWFLGQHGIISISPELGIADSNSNHFFITRYNTLQSVLLQNQAWVFNALKKITPQSQFTFANGKYYLKNLTTNEDGPQLKVEIVLIIKNKGMTDVTNKTSYIDFNHDILDSISSLHLQSLTDSLDTQDIKTWSDEDGKQYFTIPVLKSRESKRLYINFSTSNESFKRKPTSSQGIIKIFYKVNEFDSSYKYVEIFPNHITQGFTSNYDNGKQFTMIFGVVGGIAFLLCFALWTLWIVYAKFKKNRQQRYLSNLSNQYDPNLPQLSFEGNPTSKTMDIDTI